MSQYPSVRWPVSVHSLLTTLFLVVLSGCGEMGEDHGPEAKYKGVLTVSFEGGERDFLLGRYNDVSSCREVVNFELKYNEGKQVWVRPDWGYLSGGPQEGWHQVEVLGGDCLIR